jgi:hypothetical protein
MLSAVMQALSVFGLSTMILIVVSLVAKALSVSGVAWFAS